MDRGRIWSELVLIANGLSVLSSAYIIVGSLALCWQVGGFRRSPLFLRQLFGLGVADFLWGVWWFSTTGAEHSPAEAENCAVIIFVLRWCQLLSVLSSVHIAVGFLVTLSKKEVWIRRLKKSHIALLPLAFVLNLSYIFRPAFYDASIPYCHSPFPSEDIFTAYIGLAFITIVSTHAVALRAWLRGASQDVTSRSMLRIIQYLGAFLLSWSVFFVGSLLVAVHGHQKWDRWWLNTRDTLSSLNGFLNGIVYTAHNWRIFLEAFRALRRRCARGKRSIGDIHSIGSGCRTPQRNQTYSPNLRGSYSPTLRGSRPAMNESLISMQHSPSASRREGSEWEHRRLWAMLGIDSRLLYPASLSLVGAGCQEVDGTYFLVSIPEGSSDDGRPKYRCTTGHWLNWSDAASEWQISSPGTGGVLYCHSQDSVCPPAMSWEPKRLEYSPAPVCNLEDIRSKKHSTQEQPSRSSCGSSGFLGSNEDVLHLSHSSRVSNMSQVLWEES